MSDDKRFDATPSRRDKAKREGNVARSHEIAGIASFAGGLIACIAALPLLVAAAAQLVRLAAAHAPSAGAMLPLIAFAFAPAVGAAAFAVGVSTAQAGGLRLAPVTFAPQKLAPWPGLKRMFGADAAVGAARAALAFTVVTAVVAPAGMRVAATASVAGSPFTVAAAAWDGMLHAMLAAAGTGALFAFADYALVRRRWLRGLKMTFDEFKRDAKEQDGDPHTKSRRRQFHRTLSRSAVTRTREASFVVVNPTHIAIALRYAPPAVAVPDILVRAADAQAAEVRSIATGARIPIVENVALARLLWTIGEPGRPIPPEAFVAVAEVIAALARAGLATL